MAWDLEASAAEDSAAAVRLALGSHRDHQAVDGRAGLVRAVAAPKLLDGLHTPHAAQSARMLGGQESQIALVTGQARHAGRFQPGNASLVLFLGHAAHLWHAS